MDFLAIGCGSIGKRHIRNLRALKAGELIAHDVKPGRCQEVKEQYGIQTFNDLDEALAQRPDVALICTPSSLHIAPALAAAGGRVAGGDHRRPLHRGATAGVR